MGRGRVVGIDEEGEGTGSGDDLSLVVDLPHFLQEVKGRHDSRDSHNSKGSHDLPFFVADHIQNSCTRNYLELTLYKKLIRVHLEGCSQRRV